MTPAARLRAMAEKATGAPWYVVEGNDDHAMSAVGIATVPQEGSDFFGFGECTDHEKTVAVTLWQAPRIVGHESSKWEEDASLIVHLRNRAQIYADLIEAAAASVDDYAMQTNCETDSDQIRQSNALIDRLRAALAAIDAADKEGV